MTRTTRRYREGVATRMADLDTRFRVPLLTAQAASVHLDIPASTVKAWIQRDPGQPVIHAIPPETPRGPRLPFVALVEAQILRALRRSGLSMQEIRAGVEALRATTKNEYVLATRDIATDGESLLYNVTAGVAPQWARARDGQLVIRQVVDMVRRYVHFAPDGFAERLTLPSYGDAHVIIDPEFAFGQPVLETSKIRVDTIADLFYGGGESVETIADEYDLSTDEVEAVLRVLARRVG